jgi:restriction endonuclease S subunit
MNLGETKILDIERIKQNNYSLKYEDYFSEKEKENVNDFNVKLIDVCEFKNGTQLDKKKFIIGNIPVFGGGVKNVGFHNESNRKGFETIVCGTGAAAGFVNFNYGNAFWASQCFTINSKNIKILDNKYLYYYCKLHLEKEFIKKQKGQAQPYIRYTQCINMHIPVLSLDHQTEIVNFLDNIYETNNIEDTIKYINNDIFSLLITKNYDTFNDIIFYQNNIQFVSSELENVKRKKNLYLRSLFNTVKSRSEMKNLGEIVNFNIGGTPSRKESKYYNGTNLWVAISDMNNNIINDTKEKITELGIKNSSVKLIKKGSILMSFKLSIGKMAIAGTEMYCNEAIMFFKHENNITNKYLYYWLLLNNKKIEKFANGGIGKGGLNKTTLANIIIPIPSLELQQHIINEIQKTESESFHYNIYENNLKKELEIINETIKNLTENCIMDNELIIDNEINNEIDIDNEFDNDSDNERQENHSLII